MLSFETLTVIAVAVALAGGALVLFALLKRGSRRTLEHADAGDFRSVLAAATGGELDRDEMLAAAFAAKHLLDLPRARRLLETLLADDPRDGEAWLELGLVAAYDDRFDDAARAFARVADSRADLLESLTLHRAWLALHAGDEVMARRLFAEVEIPLETKLRTDMGEGDPAFAEWFLQAGDLWRERGDAERSAWALEAARRSAPQSRLIEDLVG